MIVDNEASMRTLSEAALGELGHEVLTAPDGENALQLARQRPFDMAFLDIKLPGMNGVEALRELMALQPDATYIMISGYADGALVEEAMAAGAHMCLTKPVDVQELMDFVELVCSPDPVE